MPLRGPPDGRYGGGESPGQPSRERVDPGKADTAPKAAPGFRAGPCCLAAFGSLRRGAVVLIGGATPGTPLVVSGPPSAREAGAIPASRRSPVLLAQEADAIPDSLRSQVALAGQL